MKSLMTVHGTRSSFRDWAGDATTFPREVIEQALAHRVGDCDRARLPARRCTREAPQADGRLGPLLLTSSDRQSGGSPWRALSSRRPRASR